MEGVDLDTPGYAVRGETNDIETPDDKTWFGAGRDNH